jgi:hypothetical protein
MYERYCAGRLDHRHHRADEVVIMKPMQTRLGRPGVGGQYRRVGLYGIADTALLKVCTECARRQSRRATTPGPDRPPSGKWHSQHHYGTSKRLGRVVGALLYDTAKPVKSGIGGGAVLKAAVAKPSSPIRRRPVPP